MKSIPVLRIMKYLLMVLFLISALQTTAIFFFSQNVAQPTPSDLLVVFPGDQKRLHTALELVEKNVAGRIMVIGKSSTELEDLLAKKQLQLPPIPLSGGTSRSTFEDVYQIVETCKAHDITSVALVTSDYHIPRVYLLLKAFLTFSDTSATVQLIPVKYQDIFTNKLRMYANENIKLYGSCIEMASSVLVGKMILDNPLARKVQLATKRIITFKV